MKASPRFREASAYIKLRHQPAQVKYPLLALHIAANPQAYDAEPLNVRPEVYGHSVETFLFNRRTKGHIPRQLFPRNFILADVTRNGGSRYRVTRMSCVSDVLR